MEQPELHASKMIMVQIPVHPFLLNSKEGMSTFTWCRQNTQSGRLYHKTISMVFAASLLQYDSTSGHTPIMLATTSTRPGVERSFVMIALRNAGRDAIQSQVSARFKRCTKSSVIENGSRVSNTDAAVRWRQRFISRRSKVGYSTSFARYPLPR